MEASIRSFLVRDESTPSWLKVSKAVVRRIVPQKYWHEIRNLAFRGTETYPYFSLVKTAGQECLYFVSTAAERYRLKYLVGEEGFLLEIRDSVRPGDVYFDVGAAIGTHCLPIKKAYGEAIQVVAFEPDPESYQKLTANIELNGLEIRALNGGLSDRLGKISLGTGGVDGLCPSMRPDWEGNRIEVEAWSLDGLVLPGVLPTPSVIKIDVEGAEALVIAGMDRTLRMGCIRELYLEIHEDYLPSFGSSAEKLWEKVIAYGYRPVTVRKRGPEYLCHYKMTAG